MKSSLVASLFLFGYGLVAQPYRALVNTSATWQDWFLSTTPGPDTGMWECYLYYLEGDSSVNDTLYSVLRMTGHTIHNGGQNWYSGAPVALLREDTVARKVFIRRWGWPIELLLYDFSVSLGPYPASFRYSNWPNQQVTAIDTVELSSGPHRRITLDGWETIIEGIGSTSGFMPSNSTEYIFWPNPRLVCHLVNAMQDWEYAFPTPECPCGTDVGVEESAGTELRITPTPTLDLCRLYGADPKAPFIVRSIDGRTVRSGSCSSDGSTTIDMTSLPSSIYVLETLGNSRLAAVRIIKQ